MIYFLQMNKQTLTNIWQKDGVNGIIKYGAVALRRALTSKRSNFYYKYEKYYTHIDSTTYSTNHTSVDDYTVSGSYHYKDISNLPNEKIDHERLNKLEKIDCVLVPTVGISKSGSRLGYGNGYYDKFLSTTNASKISLTYSKQIVKSIPNSPHDIKIDWIVTENEIIKSYR